MLSFLFPQTTVHETCSSRSPLSSWTMFMADPVEFVVILGNKILIFGYYKVQSYLDENVNLSFNSLFLLLPHLEPDSRLETCIKKGCIVTFFCLFVLTLFFNNCPFFFLL